LKRPATGLRILAGMKDGTRMNIGQAAAAAGVTAKTIRHYEQIGLLPAPARTAAGYRQYSAHDLSALRFIRQARRLGFSLEQIAALVGLWRDPHRASREVRALALQHVAELEQKMAEVAAMKQSLQDLVAACPGDDSPHCAILEGLAGEGPPAKSSARLAHQAESASK
jgi:Cu(I)-responsive transcriptional regulator